MEEISNNEIAIAAALAGALVGSVVGAMGASLVAGFERRRRGHKRALAALAKLTVLLRSIGLDDTASFARLESVGLYHVLKDDLTHWRFSSWPLASV